MTHTATTNRLIVGATEVVSGCYAKIPAGTSVRVQVNAEGPDGVDILAVVNGTPIFGTTSCDAIILD